MATLVTQLFDRVLMLEEGEVITLTFNNMKDLASKKTLLFREKRKYEEKLKNSLNFKEIFISQDASTKTLKLSTNGTSLDWLSTATITVGESKTPLELGKEIHEKVAERINALKNAA